MGPVWTVHSRSEDEWTSGLVDGDQFYATGSFWDTLWINGQVAATTQLGKAGFLIKSKTSLTEPFEILIAEGTGTKAIEAVATDGSEAFIAGEFTDSLFIRGVKFYTEKGKNVFVASLSELLDVTGSLVFGESAKLDVNDLERCGNAIHLGGSFLGEFSLAGNLLETRTPDIDAFLATLDMNLEPVEAYDMGGVFQDELISLSCQNDTALYGGQFIGVIRIGDEIVLESRGFETDIFAGYVFENGKLGKARSIRSSGSESIRGLEWVKQNILVTGEFSGDFQTDVDTLMGPISGFNGYVLRMDNDLLEESLSWYQSPERSTVQSISIKNDSTIYLAGFYGDELEVQNDKISTDESFQAYISEERIKKEVIDTPPQPPEPLPFEIFPNPFYDELNIQSEEETARFMLFDVSGRLVFDTSSNPPYMVPLLYSGVYIYNWEGQDGTTRNGRLLYYVP